MKQYLNKAFKATTPLLAIIGSACAHAPTEKVDIYRPAIAVEDCGKDGKMFLEGVSIDDAIGMANTIYWHETGGDPVLPLSLNEQEEMYKRLCLIDFNDDGVINETEYKAAEKMLSYLPRPK